AAACEPARAVERVRVVAAPPAADGTQVTSAHVGADCPVPPAVGAELEAGCRHAGLRQRHACRCTRTLALVDQLPDRRLLALDAGLDSLDLLPQALARQ